MKDSTCANTVISLLPAMIQKVNGHNAPDISVVIVSWNSKEFLENCLDSLAKGIESPYEVIVFDNDSMDGSPEMVASKFPWVKLIQSGSNLGFAKGNNIGIQHCRGRYITLVNSDVKVLPGCLDRLAKYLDENPDVGMVGPRVFYGDGRQQSSCRHYPSLWNNACEALGLNQLFPKSRLFAGEHMFYFTYDQTCEVDVLVGCFIMARRKAVSEFGFLDEDFFMYGEDVDWSWRCKNTGWKVMFYPRAKAIHYCGGSSRNQPLRFAEAQQISLLKLWRKHNNRNVVFGFIIIAIFKHCIRIVWGAVTGLLMHSERKTTIETYRAHSRCLRVLLKEFISS